MGYDVNALFGHIHLAFYIGTHSTLQTAHHSSEVTLMQTLSRLTLVLRRKATLACSIYGTTAAVAPRLPAISNVVRMSKPYTQPAHHRHDLQHVETPVIAEAVVIKRTGKAKHMGCKLECHTRLLNRHKPNLTLVRRSRIADGSKSKPPSRQRYSKQSCRTVHHLVFLTILVRFFAYNNDSIFATSGSATRPDASFESPNANCTWNALLNRNDTFTVSAGDCL